MTDFVVGLTLTADGQLAVVNVQKVDKAVEDLAATTRKGKKETADHAKVTAEDTAAVVANTKAQKEAATATAAAGKATEEAAGKINRHDEAVRQSTRSAGQQRAAYQQLGFQIQDVTQQIALGINPMTIFAQQGGQVAFAMSQFGGSVGRVGAVLSGPFGAAALGAVTILGALGTAFLHNRDAAEEAQATFETLGEITEKLKEKIDAAIGSQEQLTRAIVETAREGIIADQKKLADAQAELNRIFQSGQAEAYSSEVRALQSEIKELTSGIEEAQHQVDRFDLKTFADGLTAAQDKISKAKRDYEDTVFDINRKFADNQISEAAAQEALRNAEALRDSLISAAEAEKLLADEQAKATKALDREAERRAVAFERLSGQIDKFALGYDTAIDKLLGARETLAKLSLVDAYEAGGGNADIALAARFNAMKVTVDAEKRSLVSLTDANKKASDDVVQIWREATEQIQNFIADQIFDFTKGDLDSVEDIANAYVDIWRRAFAELATVSLIRPGGLLNPTGSLLGPLASVMGTAPANDNQPATVTLDTKSGLGKGLSELTMGLDKLGARLGLGDVSKDFQGPLLPGQTAGTTLSSLLGTGLQGLGMAGLGLGLGKSLGNLLGLGRTGGSILGGAGAGALAGSVIPGIGTAIGAGIGAAIGGISSALKKTPRAQVDLVSGGGGDIFTRGKGEDSTAIALRDAMNKGLEQIAQLAGGAVRSGLAFGTLGQRGDEFFFDPRTGLKDKQYGDPSQYRYATADEATLAALKEAIRDGVITGMSDTARTIASNSTATTPDDFVADLQFAATYDELTQLGRATSDYLDEIKALNKQFADAARQAAALGLGTKELAQSYAAARQQIADDFNRGSELAILNVTDPIRAQLEAFNDDAKQYLLDAAGAGADLALANRKVAVERQALIDELTQGTTQAFASFRDQVSDLLNDLRFGEQSGIASRDRLPDLLAHFYDLAGRAGTDEQARDDLTGAAQAALDAAAEAYASSADYYNVQRQIEAALAGLQNLTGGIDVGAIAADVGTIEMDPEFQRSMDEIGREIATGNEQMVAVMSEVRDLLAGIKANQTLPVGSAMAGELWGYARQLKAG